MQRRDALAPISGHAPTSPRLDGSAAVPVPGAAPRGAGSGCQGELLPQGWSVWGEAIPGSHRAGTGRSQGEQEPGEGSTSPAACSDMPGPHGLPAGPGSFHPFRAVPARAGQRMEGREHPIFDLEKDLGVLVGEEFSVRRPCGLGDPKWSWVLG